MTMRYRLATLLKLQALGPLLLALFWYALIGGRYAGAALSITALASLWTIIACWPRIVGKSR
jgi:hypothetical protein